MTAFSFHFSSNEYFRVHTPLSIKAEPSLLERAAEQGWKGLGRLLGSSSG